MHIERVGPHTFCEDARGVILGVANTGEWREVNYAFTRAGTVRGNHFHETTRELIFIVSGRVRVEMFEVDAPTNLAVFELSDRQGIIVPTRVLHTLHYETDSVHISLLDRPFDPSAPDLHGMPRA